MWLILLITCGGSVLLAVGLWAFMLAIKQTEPRGCFLFFGLLFLVCLGGMIIPQLIL